MDQPLVPIARSPLLVAPRKVRAIYQNDRKSDRRDAGMLARIARTDESLIHPVEHRREEMQSDLLQIKLRDNLVRQRVDIISSVRFTLKSLGIRVGPSNTTCLRAMPGRPCRPSIPAICNSSSRR